MARFVRFECGCDWEGNPQGDVVIDAERVTGFEERSKKGKNWTSVSCASGAEFYLLRDLDSVMSELDIVEDVTIAD